jgi:hypothetical protein
LPLAQGGGGRIATYVNTVRQQPAKPHGSKQSSRPYDLRGG